MLCPCFGPEHPYSGVPEPLPGGEEDGKSGERYPVWLPGRPPTLQVARGKQACAWVGAGDSGELRGSSAGRSPKVCAANLASHGKRKGAGGTDLGLRERPEGPAGPEEDRRPPPRPPGLGRAGRLGEAELAFVPQVTLACSEVCAPEK